MIKVIIAILKVFVALCVLALAGYYLVKNDLLPKEVLQAFKISKVDSQIYYQWTDQNGNVQISRSPPEGRNYSTFQGSKDLVTTDEMSEPVNKKATPENTPQAKVLSTYRDSLRDQLITKEMTTQCRWLLNQLFNIEKEIYEAENKEPGSSYSLCREYREQLKSLPAKHCKTSPDDLKVDFC